MSLIKGSFPLVLSKLQRPLLSSYRTYKQELHWNKAEDVFPQVVFHFSGSENPHQFICGRFFPSFFCFFASEIKKENIVRTQNIHRQRWWLWKWTQSNCLREENKCFVSHHNNHLSYQPVCQNSGLVPWPPAALSWGLIWQAGVLYNHFISF